MTFDAADPRGPGGPRTRPSWRLRRLTPRGVRVFRLRALSVLAVSALAILAAGCGAKAVRRSPRVSVTVAKAERRSVPLELAASGTIEPIQSAAVGSQVGGVIMRIRIHEGDFVRAGQVLVELDPRPFRAELDQARGVLARDRAQAQTARLDAERARKMVDQGMISQAEWEQKRAAADATAGSVTADSAAVANARLNLDYASIRAPISGRTGRLNVHVGDLVKSGTSEPLVTINQINPIRVRFTVAQSELSSIQKYRGHDPRVIVRPVSEDSTQIEGRLVFVDNSVDLDTGTLLLKGELKNADGRLWPGEFVEVRLVLTTQKDALVVPSTAVTRGQQGTYVYVMNADSTAASRPVTVLRSDDLITVLSSGLEAGETVVTDGQFRLSPGSKMLVREPGQGSTGGTGGAPGGGDAGGGHGAADAKAAASGQGGQGAQGSKGAKGGAR